MSNASCSRSSRHTFRGKFKQLIENLRKQTDFKQVTAQIQPHSLPLRSFNHEDMIHNDILPITQSPPDNSVQENHSIYSNSTAIAKIRAEVISYSKDGSLDEEGSNGNFDEENSQFLVNQLTDLLKPSQKMQFDKKQGRVGVIMRQRFRQSKRQPFILPRYTKVPRQKNILAQQSSLAPSVIKKNTFKQVNQVNLINFWNTNNKLTSASTTQQIYLYFSKLLQQLNIRVQSPTIKRYNTCIYFGEDTQKCEKYEGIIYYFDKKIYCGQICKGSKHGEGVQINFDKGITYKGKFEYGKKNGMFRVQKERENYEGQLEHGIYHGKGILMTSQYKYEGLFQNGNKHGLGQQIYPKTGLVLKGYFKNGQFQNIDISKPKVDPSSEVQLKVKPEKILLKNNSYDIDFQLQQTFKRQIIPASNQRIQPQEDSKSLYDLLTQNKKTNKYDFDALEAKQKLPKIRIQGMNFGFKHPNYQNQQQQKPFNMSKNLIPLQKSRQQIPIRKRYHSQQQKQNLFLKQIQQQQIPLGRHNLQSPLRTNK